MRKVLTRARRHWRLRSATAVTLTGALVASMGLAIVSASAVADDTQAIHKSYVCKYVGKPGVDERLQEGGNPIWVDNHALSGKDEATYVGQEFSDAHGLSLVIVANTPRLDQEPTVTACPDYIQVPAVPSVDDPCNLPGVTSNVAFVVPNDTDQLDWTLLQNGDLKVVPKLGYRFADSSQEVVFQLPADRGILCPQARTPAGIDTDDPCGPNNVSWSAKSDGFFDYGVSEGMIRATLKPQFANDTVTGTTSWVLPVDSNSPCPESQPSPTPVDLEDIAPVVTFTDPDCENLDGAAWDGSLEPILDYKVFGEPGLGETVLVEAVIEQGLAGKYEFADGAQTSFTHTYPTLVELDCVRGEETVIPKPDTPVKPEPKPDKAPTVKGVQAVAPPAAAPTAVAAGLAGGTGQTTAQLLGQSLAGVGLLMLVAAGWLALGRRTRGAHLS